MPDVSPVTPSGDSIPSSPATAAAKEAGETTKEPSPLELLLRVHGGLSRLIAPATPVTLVATKAPASRLARMMPFSTMPGVVRFSVWWSLVSLVGFLISVPPIQPTSDQAATSQATGQSTATP